MPLADSNVWLALALSKCKAGDYLAFRKILIQAQGRLGQACRHPGPTLQEGPVAKPWDWLTWVDGAETEAELAALRRSGVRGMPYGAEGWQKEMAQRLGLQATILPLRRPRKPKQAIQYA